MLNWYDFMSIYILQFLDLGVVIVSCNLRIQYPLRKKGIGSKWLIQRLKQLTYLYFSFCVLTRMFFKTIFFVYSLPGSHPCQVSLLTISTP